MQGDLAEKGKRPTAKQKGVKRCSIRDENAGNRGTEERTMKQAQHWTVASAPRIDRALQRLVAFLDDQRNLFHPHAADIKARDLEEKRGTKEEAGELAAVRGSAASARKDAAFRTLDVLALVLAETMRSL